jgi:hypothetical protein
MLANALKLVLLRFLPRRLVPFLAAVEVIRMILRLRNKQPEVIVPRRLITVEGVTRDVDPSGTSSSSSGASSGGSRAGWDSNPRPKD